MEPAQALSDKEGKKTAQNPAVTAAAAAAGARREAEKKRAKKEDSHGEKEGESASTAESSHGDYSHERASRVIFSSTAGPSRIRVPLVDRVYEAHTHVGLRQNQEDRLVLCPRLMGRDDVALAAVFDGTAGDEASHFCQQNFLNVLQQCLDLCRSESAGSLLTATPPSSSSSAPSSARTGRPLDSGSGVRGGKIQGGARATPNYSVSSTVAPPPAATKTLPLEDVAGVVARTMRQAFLHTDAALLRHCKQHALHYASSTGVAALLWKDLLTVAHVGDSRACLATLQPSGKLRAKWLTTDHKPDDPDELERIEAAGGSLVWLHGNKPYIRGADFKRRQANDEHPKQLNYSRAFGGKDLKGYGLSAEPNVSQFEVQEDARLLLIASDGLWDVMDAEMACLMVMDERRAGNPNPTEKLVAHAIRRMPMFNVRDNVTVVAIYLNESRAS